MKFRVTTTYENIDQQWMKWYLDRLNNEEALPGSTVIVEELKECGHAVYKSKDPTSDVVGITEYEVLK